MNEAVKTYYEKTHHKLVVMGASGGKKISQFSPSSSTNLYNAMVTKYQMAENYILNMNNHYKIRNKFYVVYQGESDIEDSSNYINEYMNVHNSLLNDLKLSFGSMVYVVNASLSNPANDNNTLILREIQQNIVSSNNNIIMGSDFPYNQIVQGNYSIFCTPNNTIHLNSAGLSQVGRDVATAIYNSKRLK